jgi:hypothetical protein
MKKLIAASVLILVILIAFACKKDDGEARDYNMLKITSGEHSGFAHTYAPNQGFWSPVNATTKYVHLVFGNTDNATVTGKDILSILFYDEGTGNVNFPSAQGQHVNIGITVEGTEKYYDVDNAGLTITELTASRFKGTLSGTFFNVVNNSETITVSMDIDIPLAEL